MGISGLLPLLRSIHRPTELSKFKGETFGIDAYGWLHRASISCAIDLAQGKSSRRYVDFALNRVQMMRHHGVAPYMVFDGDFLPSKAATEISRAQRREEGRQRGLELLKAGKPSQAQLELKKAIDVTPEMARQLIEALKRANVPYVVAPYEADAQLVYLERQGIISGIISEDSDMLVFGAKRLITKLDQYGHCIEVNRRDFNACREVSFVGWDDTMFRRMSILSGCDYLEGLPRIGLKTAHALLRKHKTVERVVRVLQFEGKQTVPADYLTLFTQAEHTFLYQWAFCPVTKQLVNLTALPSDLDLENLPFIGKPIEPELAQRIATGEVNPITKQVIPVSPLPSPRKRTASTAYRSNPIPSPSTQNTPKKPIEQYFKGSRRIPLGEMDPNCFDVNPEQTTEEGARPIVFPLPRPYIDNAALGPGGRPRAYINRDGNSLRPQRRQTEPVSSLLTGNGRTLSPHSRRTTAGPVATGSSQSPNSGALVSPRPPKKARLCGDGGINIGPVEEKSKFFSKVSSKPQTTARRRSEGYLMSDDSVEEALNNLPDLEGWSIQQDRRKTISVFSSEQLSTGEQGITKDDGNTQPDISSNLDHEQQVAATDAPVTDTPLKSRLVRYTYGSGGPLESSQQLRRQSSTSSVRSSLVSRTPASAASKLSTAPTTPATTPRLTPLQRLGKQAVARNRQLSTSKFEAPRPPKRGSLGRMSLDSIPINPVPVPLALGDVATPDVLHKPIGSEDLLVSDSDAEELKNLSPVESTGPGRAMDLSRYMFA
ncbi:hypothetical protein GGS20DRAFT_534913 [Poronia punctata]|nr:hypothetical protein GGS20DRAFT_534913 [Poronia punctata]